jgi:hypothetical protein
MRRRIHAVIRGVIVYESASGAAQTARTNPVLGGSPMQQMSIAAYLRNLAVRCTQIARSSTDPRVQEALETISTELADKAEVLEATFRLPTPKR